MALRGNREAKFPPVPKYGGGSTMPRGEARDPKGLGWACGCLRVLLLLVGIFIFGCREREAPPPRMKERSTTPPSPHPPPPKKEEKIPLLKNVPKGAVKASVTEVIDGDTFKALVGERKETVRLIGVDTPETRHPLIPEEPLGREAHSYTRSRLEGKRIFLTFDVQKRDKYGRLLAYVWLEDGTFFNAELLREGYAQIMTIPPNVKYTDLFLSLQRKARSERKGFWGFEFEEERTAPAIRERYYVGNLRSKVFHRPQCGYARRVSPRNRVVLKEREGAFEQGYRPCRWCKP